MDAALFNFTALEEWTVADGGLETRDLLVTSMSSLLMRSACRSETLNTLGIDYCPIITESTECVACSSGRLEQIKEEQGSNSTSRLVPSAPSLPSNFGPLQTKPSKHVILDILLALHIACNISRVRIEKMELRQAGNIIFSSSISSLSIMFCVIENSLLAHACKSRENLPTGFNSRELTALAGDNH